jgi:hypothetical protein
MPSTSRLHSEKRAIRRRHLGCFLESSDFVADVSSAFRKARKLSPTVAVLSGMQSRCRERFFCFPE